MPRPRLHNFAENSSKGENRRKKRREPEKLNHNPSSFPPYRVHYTSNITTNSQKKWQGPKTISGRGVHLLPAQIHLTLRPSIHTRLEFAHTLYLRSATYAAVLYALQHALWNAPDSHGRLRRCPSSGTPATMRSPAGCWATTTPCYPTANSRPSKPKIHGGS